MKKKIIIIGFILLFVLISFLGIQSVNNSKGNTSNGNGKLTNVEYFLPEEVFLEESITTKGVVTTKNTDIVYADTDGKIIDISVSKGDSIAIGDTLFTYDSEYLKDLEDALKEANLNLEIAKVNLGGYRNSYNSINSNTEGREIEQLSLELQVFNAENTLKEFGTQLTNLESEIEKAQTEVNKANEEYDKQVILYNNGIISKSVLDSYTTPITAAETALKNLKNQKESLSLQMDQAEYNLEIANKNLNYSSNPQKFDTVQQQQQALNTVKVAEINVEQLELNISKIQEKINNFITAQQSQYNGVVTNVLVPEGTTVQKGMGILEITDISNDNIIVQLEVAQKNISKMEVGQKVEITSSGFGDVTLMGTIEKIMSVAETKVANSEKDSVISVEVTFDNNENLEIVKSGFSVDGKVIVEQVEDALVVPILSVDIDEEGEYYIYIINDDDILEKKYVKLGAIQGSNIRINNIEADERIVSGDLRQLNDGDKVNPVESN